VLLLPSGSRSRATRESRQSRRIMQLVLLLPSGSRSRSTRESRQSRRMMQLGASGRPEGGALRLALRATRAEDDLLYLGVGASLHQKYCIDFGQRCPKKCKLDQACLLHNQNFSKCINLRTDRCPQASCRRGPILASQNYLG
jgi:hypothetical protein